MSRKFEWNGGALPDVSGGMVTTVGLNADTAPTRLAAGAWRGASGSGLSSGGTGSSLRPDERGPQLALTSMEGEDAEQRHTPAGRFKL